MKEPTSFEPLSQSSYFIEGYFNEQVLSSATCFFVNRNERVYLITNWHVVTGKNNQTKVHLAPSLSEPNKLVVKVFKNQDELVSDDLVILLNDFDGKPLWLEHPEFKEQVDVIAIEVRIPTHLLVFDVERFIEPFNEETTISVKEDVFVLGYPFGFRAGELFPIWKRASIASEPLLDLDDLPKFLVDTSTKPGMSGSPVIKMEKRAVGLANGTPGKIGVQISNHRMGLAGIYSGRIGVTASMDMQLGVVWKISVLDEIINQTYTVNNSE